MADLYVVQELRTYLIAQGVAQDAASAPSLTVPSIHVDPFDGAPLPRRSVAGAQIEKGTITILDTMASPAAQLEAWIEETYIDIVVRHRDPAACRSILRAIRELIHPNASNGGRKDWFMNSLRVENSWIWKGEQPLPFAEQGDTDVISRVTSFCFACRRKSLQNLPYAP